jgi:dihydropteroate synthase
MKADGADIIDVGGESTRPGAVMPDEQEEIRRIAPVIERIATELGLPVSVDTRRAKVAKAALAAGAEIVNDVSGLTFDPEMARTVADAGAGVIIMHMRGTPADMDSHAVYGDVVTEVARELGQAVARARGHGISAECIVLDPGLGFAKTAEHNLALIANLDRLAALEYPVLVGPSRKRFLGTVTGKAVNQRDAATAAACVAARLRGASLFRVHDVAGAREALQVADAIVASGIGHRASEL